MSQRIKRKNLNVFTPTHVNLNIFQILFKKHFRTKFFFNFFNPFKYFSFVLLLRCSRLTKLFPHALNFFIYILFMYKQSASKTPTKMLTKIARIFIVFTYVL